MVGTGGRRVAGVRGKGWSPSAFVWIELAKHVYSGKAVGWRGTFVGGSGARHRSVALGVVIVVLVTRRNAEVTIFLTKLTSGAFSSCKSSVLWEVPWGVMNKGSEREKVLWGERGQGGFYRCPEVGRHLDLESRQPCQWP